MLVWGRDISIVVKTSMRCVPFAVPFLLKTSRQDKTQLVLVRLVLFGGFWYSMGIWVFSYLYFGSGSFEGVNWFIY